MALYFCGSKFFYAWGADDAVKRTKKLRLIGTLYIINEYGYKKKVRMGGR